MYGGCVHQPRKALIFPVDPKHKQFINSALDVDPRYSYKSAYYSPVAGLESLYRLSYVGAETQQMCFFLRGAHIIYPTIWYGM